MISSVFHATPPIDPGAAWYLVCLGLALGMTVLAMTAYARISPRWLRWSLLASGAFVACRYLTMAAFASSADPEALGAIKRCWFASSIGLTFPGAVAVDQLVRHPAMTPKKLLRWLAPFLLVYTAVLLFGRFELADDPIAGASVKLLGWGRAVIIVAHSAFVAGISWVTLQLIPKLPDRKSVV